MAEREETTRSSGEAGEGGTLSRGLGRLTEYPRRFRQFTHEAKVELKHVSWPTRDDVKATTTVVIVTVFVFGLFLFLVDSVASRIIQRVLEAFK
jgi:preprotein translocase subunit SecE